MALQIHRGPTTCRFTAWREQGECPNYYTSPLRLSIRRHQHNQHAARHNPRQKSHLYHKCVYIRPPPGILTRHNPRQGDGSAHFRSKRPQTTTSSITNIRPSSGLQRRRRLHDRPDGRQHCYWRRTSNPYISRKGASGKHGVVWEY